MSQQLDRRVFRHLEATGRLDAALVLAEEAGIQASTPLIKLPENAYVLREFRRSVERGDCDEALRVYREKMQREDDNSRRAEDIEFLLKLQRLLDMIRNDENLEKTLEFARGSLLDGKTDVSDVSKDRLKDIEHAVSLLALPKDSPHPLLSDEQRAKTVDCALFLYRGRETDFIKSLGSCM